MHESRVKMPCFHAYRAPIGFQRSSLNFTIESRSYFKTTNSSTITFFFGYTDRKKSTAADSAFYRQTIWHRYVSP